ncbi:adenylate/guanylate cyclase domain-containing protein [Nocardioides sp. YIM 152588]|uniref:adenylate/guanylate cyclase domain-containing protein n=1 Tax=Nocardioides sp. YIM 152588 TaxID=3158259 RepID=UPI0032E4EC70
MSGDAAVGKGRGPGVTEVPRPSQEDIDATFLGSAPVYTAEEVAERAGLPVEKARRLWRTLGFADRGEVRAYTEADVVALQTLGEVIDEGLLDLDIALNVARGVGLTMARLADWEVGALTGRADDLFREAGPEATHGETPASLLFARYGPRFEMLMAYAWRRHLAAAVTRMESTRAMDADPGTTHLTVGFADIVGFTALSNEVSRDAIGDIVEKFESRCADVISSHHGRLIKSMGDAVLFVNDDPMRSFTTAEGIINVIGRDKRMPEVRVGLATGSVVLRLGDVFGPPVNMASRLTAVARRNRIIVDAATAAALPRDQIESRPLPPRPVRGFGVVEPVAVRRP